MTTINQANAVYYRVGQLGGGHADKVYAGSVQVWPPKAGYRDIILATPGLVGYWRLSEPSNASATVDETGNNTGYYANAPTLGVPGPKLTAMRTGAQGLGVISGPFHEFVGAVGDGEPLPELTGDDLRAMRVLDLGDGPLSMESWINMQGATGGLRCCNVSKGSGAYYMRLDSNGSVRMIKAAVVDMGGSTVPVPNTGWHHIVGTKNGPTMHVYIDAVDRTGAMANSTLVNNAQQLFVGADNQNGYHGEVLNGDLAEVAVYNQVLTPAQVLEHYNAMLA